MLSLFTLPILFVAAVFALRFWKRRRKLAVRLQQPGRSPERPLTFSRFDEIDERVRAARCGCGALLVRMSEGSRSTAEGSVRVVYCECSACEQEHSFFFRQDKLLH